MLGLAAQGVKICVDTILQREVDDGFRGRVFTVYDMVFNGVFVAAAALAAVVLPAERLLPPGLPGPGAGLPGDRRRLRPAHPDRAVRP